MGDITAKVLGYNRFGVEATVHTSSYHATEQERLSKLETSLGMFYGMFYNSTVEKWKTDTDTYTKQLAHWYVVKEEGKKKTGTIKIIPKKQGVAQHRESYGERDFAEANPGVPYQKFDVSFFIDDKNKRDEHRRNFVRFLENRI